VEQVVEVTGEVQQADIQNPILWLAEEEAAAIIMLISSPVQCYTVVQELLRGTILVLIEDLLVMPEQ
jgi:hypothetical protein